MTMPTRPTEPQRPLVSLQRRFAWVLAGVIGLFVAGMAMSLMFSKYSNDRAEARLLSLEAKQTQANVSQHWAYYLELAKNLARDPELIDLIQVGSTNELENWALSRQRLLPSILGLALVNAQGEVEGDGNLLKVGPACQRDLLRYNNKTQNLVLVHREQTGAEHVDLVVGVQSMGGELLGKVFVSIQMDYLQRVLNESALPGHAISVIDENGGVVVSSGQSQTDMRTMTLPLPMPGWRLTVQSGREEFRDGGLHLLAGVITLVGVLVLLVIVVTRLRRPVRQEVHAALDALACLTRNESAPPIVTQYVEFVPVAEAINRIAQQVHDQRELLSTLSLTDSLTGLPNRRAFERRFPHMLGLSERGHPVALVLLDVDHFKSINDRFGHGVGDQALVALADTLKALTRSADMAARLAGDEFVLLLTDLDKAGVQAWYQRLTDRFALELRASGLNLDNTVSAGHTWLQSMVGDNVGRALARADQALYQAKEHGRGRLAFNADVDPNRAE